MQDKQLVIEHIQQGFSDTERPSDAFLQGSTRVVNRVKRSRRSLASPIGRTLIPRCLTPATPH